MADPVVRQIFNLQETRGDLGVEIEVEGCYLPSSGMSGVWRCTHDGSLRGEESMEYVLHHPLNLDGVNAALDRLVSRMAGNETIIDDSIRAGVHIHVNCQELNMTQLFTYIITYMVVEDVMVNYCGEGRQGNLFCLRNKDAEAQAYHIAELARTRRLQGWNNDNVRYASCNITSIPKFGSLEFRALRTPSVENFDRISMWAEALLNMRNESMKFSNPREVIDKFNEMGPVGFLEKILGNQYQEIVSATPDAVMALVGTLRNAKDIACATDWENMSYSRFLPGEGEDDEAPFHPTPPRPRRMRVGDTEPSMELSWALDEH